jgi:glycosyltransferase involved in cell wall biosynthesis
VAGQLALTSRGDALTPYLAAALRTRYPTLVEVSPELTQLQRLMVAASTVRPSRSAWAERFYKSAWAYKLRSSNADRRLAAVPGRPAAAVQVHVLFETTSPPSLLYIDCTHHQSAEFWPPWNPLSGAELAAWYARERAVYHRAAHLFTFSEPTKRSLIDDYGVSEAQITVTNAGLNLFELPDLPVGPAQPTAAPTILFIGNDFLRKGGPELIDAFKIVRLSRPDARLQLVGTNPPGVVSGDGVEVLGRIHDRGRIEQLYRDASVFVMPSHFDPFGLVLLEAMAFSLPTIASQSCGIPEIVQDKVTGALLTRVDGDTIAAAILDSINDPAEARRRGLAGRARVEAQFTWQAIVQRMAPAIDAALQ